MKTMLQIIFALVVLFLLFGVEISFKPFKFEITQLHEGIGVIFIVIGLIFFGYHYEKKGYREGFHEGTENYNDAIIELYGEEQAHECLDLLIKNTEPKD